MRRRKAAMVGHSHRHFFLPVVASLFLLGLTLVFCEEDTGTQAGADGENPAKNATEPWNKTGIPQIDYVNDPNLPRELNGYNLSSYPFLNKVPKGLNFSCDGLKDGFYASIEYKCQLYHHCLFGTRYDFLCANYTAFDQRTFICTFVSDVDCPNSAKFFHRNDALYISPTTTTAAPLFGGHRGISSGRRVRPAVLQAAAKEKDYQEKELEEEPEDGAPLVPRKQNRPRVSDDLDERRPASRRRCGPRRGRRCRRPRPRPVYYDYDDYYDEYDTGGRRNRYQEYDYYEEDVDPAERPAKSEKKKNSTPASTTKKTVTTTTTEPSVVVEEVELDPELMLSNREKIFSQGRSPPRIRPPVPRKEKAKYDAIQGRKTGPVSPTTTTARAPELPEPELDAEYEYYDDIEEVKPVVTERPPKHKNFSYKSAKTTKATTTSTTTTTTTTTPPPIYEYEYEDSEEEEVTSPPTSTTTTYKPAKKFGPRRSQSQDSHVVDNHFVGAVPATAHEEINSALESPSRVPSLRQPYSNRPRPNSITPGTTIPTTTLPNNIYDPRYNDYTQDDSGLESSTQRQQRFWQRTPTGPTPIAIMTSSTPLVPDYMSYQETAIPRRYGQRPQLQSRLPEYTVREYSQTPPPSLQPQPQLQSDDYYTQSDDPRTYSPTHSVEPSYSTSHVTRSQSHRRRGPTAEDEAAMYARPSAKPQFISLMQDHEDAYYQHQPRSAPSQNIHVQMTPTYAISESGMMGALLSQYKPIRSGQSQSQSHSQSHSRAVVSPYPVYLRSYPVPDGYTPRS